MQGNEILGVYNWRLAPHFSQLQRFSSRTCSLRHHCCKGFAAGTTKPAAESSSFGEFHHRRLDRAPSPNSLMLRGCQSVNKLRPY